MSRARGPQPFGEQTDLRRLARAVDPFERDEMPHPWALAWDQAFKQELPRSLDPRGQTRLGPRCASRSAVP